MGSGVSKGGTPTQTSGTTVSTHFRHGAPAVKFDEAIGCFKAVGHTNKIAKDGTVRSVTTTSQPGYLYRLVNNTTGQWHFYNDTTSYVFVVTGYFGEKNAIRPLGTTRMFREMPSRLVVAELTVGPLETLGYIEGQVADGFDITFSATARRSASTPSLRTMITSRSATQPTTSMAAYGPGISGRGLDASAIIEGGPRPLSPAPSTTVSYCPHCHTTTVVHSNVTSPAPSAALSFEGRAPAAAHAHRANYSKRSVSTGITETDGVLTVSTSSSRERASNKAGSHGRDGSTSPMVMESPPNEKKQTAQPDSMRNPSQQEIVLV